MADWLAGGVSLWQQIQGVRMMAATVKRCWYHSLSLSFSHLSFSHSLSLLHNHSCSSPACHLTVVGLSLTHTLNYSSNLPESLPYNQPFCNVINFTLYPSVSLSAYHFCHWHSVPCLLLTPSLSICLSSLPSPLHLHPSLSCIISLNLFSRIATGNFNIATMGGAWF